jgi:hexosaminidase
MISIRPIAVVLFLTAIYLADANLEPASEAGLWPLPKSFTFGSDTIYLNPNKFEIRMSFHSDLITDVIGRFHNRLFSGAAVPSIQIQYPPPPVWNNQNGTGSVNAETSRFLGGIQMKWDSNSEELKLGVDESYTLAVPNESGAFIQLNANNIFGIMRGLETVLQLAFVEGFEEGHTNLDGFAPAANFLSIKNTPISIEDAPRFPWRGMLVDTARHFFSIEKLKQIIDALSWNKMNVFHWHIVDAESFPLELKSRPELSEKSRWTIASTYSQKQIKELTEYALYRGVRVVVEVDTPGHTYSWGRAFPNIIANCSKYISSRSITYPQINSIPLDLTKDETYEVLKDVLQETAVLFKDEFIHLGGDELITKCYDEFPEIKQWMRDHNMNDSSYVELVRYYQEKVIQYVQEKNKHFVVWQEAWEHFVGLPTNPFPANGATMVQVWKGENGPVVQNQLEQILTGGYAALLSAGYYLDVQIPNVNQTWYLALDVWKNFYLNEPLSDELLNKLSPEQLSQFKGAEVCQWGEQVEEWSIDKMWAPALAAFERYWSPRSVNDPNQAYPRLIRQRCRMLQRGLNIQPLRPDHCSVFRKPQVDDSITGSFPTWLIVLEAVIFAIVLAGMIAVIVIYYKKIREVNDTHFSAVID